MLFTQKNTQEKKFSKLHLWLFF